MDIETVLGTEIDSILMQLLTQKKLYDLWVVVRVRGVLKIDTCARDWLCLYILWCQPLTVNFKLMLYNLCSWEISINWTRNSWSTLHSFPIKSLPAQIHGYLIHHYRITYMIQTVSVTHESIISQIFGSVLHLKEIWNPLLLHRFYIVAELFSVPVWLISFERRNCTVH